MNVPCIDLDGKCKTLMESLGKNYVTWYWYMHLDSGVWSNYSSGASDDVHFQESGATEMARLVIAGIQESSYNSMKTLAPAIAPTYTVTFNRNNSNGIVTRTQSFPNGATVHAQARPNSGHSFLNWTGGLSSSSRITRFTMGTASKTITGNFQ